MESAKQHVQGILKTPAETGPGLIKNCFQHTHIAQAAKHLGILDISLIKKLIEGTRVKTAEPLGRNMRN